MNKKFLAIMGVALMGASAYMLNKTNVESNVADADTSTIVSIGCSDEGLQMFAADQIAGTLSLSGSSKSGPGTSCSAGSFTITSGVDSESTTTSASCSRSAQTLSGYVKAPKFGAGGLGCTTVNNVKSIVYGATSNQNIALDIQSTTTNYTGTNRFDNLTSATSGLVVYGTSGKVSTTPVGDGGSTDGQASVATDGFVVTGGSGSPWYIGFQLSMGTSAKTSVMNANQTAS